MTPRSPQDETYVAQLREKLPAVHRLIYMNAGTNGPLPAFTAQTVGGMFRQQSDEGFYPGHPFSKTPGPAPAQEARAALAAALGAPPETVALTTFTTAGINIALHGMDWQPGDEVITTTLEHPGLLTPLSILARRRGIIVRFADVGRGDPQQVFQAVTNLFNGRTRMIALSHVFWSTGAVAPIQELAHWARERDVLTVIDGAQAAGAIPLDLAGTAVDFYAVPGQKWLLGPDGTGGLYVAPQALERIAPTFGSYFTAQVQAARAAYFVPHEGARRLDSGGFSPALLAGLAASCRWVAETIGLPWIQARIAHLVRAAHAALAGVDGITILTPTPAGGPVSGIVTFAVEGRKDKEVTAQLGRHDIYVRSIPFAPYGVRLSLGFYNTEEEIRRVAEVLKTPAGNDPGNPEIN